MLAWLALPGSLIFFWGLWAFWLDWVLLGGAMAVLPKFWFLDRMVWLVGDWERTGGRVWAEPK